MTIPFAIPHLALGYLSRSGPVGHLVIARLLYYQMNQFSRVAVIRVMMPCAMHCSSCLSVSQWLSVCIAVAVCLHRNSCLSAPHWLAVCFTLAVSLSVCFALALSDSHCCFLHIAVASTIRGLNLCSSPSIANRGSIAHPTLRFLSVTALQSNALRQVLNLTLEPRCLFWDRAGRRSCWIDRRFTAGLSLSLRSPPHTSSISLHRKLLLLAAEQIEKFDEISSIVLVPFPVQCFFSLICRRFLRLSPLLAHASALTFDL